MITGIKAIMEDDDERPERSNADGISKAGQENGKLKKKKNKIVFPLQFFL